ncbi:MAG: hypothetical protein IPP67_00025 [Rhodospirillaceae bacterium]|nr:hypothetical protein [Rhodospirillaceae bacterium]
MAIPKFYELMLPVLQLAQSLNNPQEIKTSLAIQELSRLQTDRKQNGISCCPPAGDICL